MKQEWMVLDCAVCNDIATYERFYNFKWFENKTGLTRSQVRRACRSLSKKGLMAYSNALRNEEGDFKGAGYTITWEGLEAWEAGPAHVARVRPGSSITWA